MCCKNCCKCSCTKNTGYQPEAKPEFVPPPPLVKLGPPKKPYIDWLKIHEKNIPHQNR